MRTSNVLLFSDNHVEVGSEEVPTPEPGWATVRVEECVIDDAPTHATGDAQTGAPGCAG